MNGFPPAIAAAGWGLAGLQPGGRGDRAPGVLATGPWGIRTGLTLLPNFPGPAEAKRHDRNKWGMGRFFPSGDKNGAESVCPGEYSCLKTKRLEGGGGRG